MRRIAFLACIAAAAAVPARAQTAPPPADSAAKAAPARRDPSLITAAELDGQTATDVYEVVRRLRPQSLRAPGGGACGNLRLHVRGSNEDAARRPASSTVVSPTATPVRVVVSVFIDGSPAGEVGALRRLRVGNVRELQFHPSADAVTRWGKDSAPA